MSADRLEVVVTVTYDAELGYIATAPELRQPIIALSLGSLHRRIEAAVLPDSVDVRLVLDHTAEHRRAQLAG
jgi:hypothetical protein